MGKAKAQKPAFSVDVDLQDRGDWTVGGLLSAVRDENPDCKVWAEGEKLYSVLDTERFHAWEILTTMEGLPMISCK